MGTPYRPERGVCSDSIVEFGGLLPFLLPNYLERADIELKVVLGIFVADAAAFSLGNQEKPLNLSRLLHPPRLSNHHGFVA
jgi:hypothetical protein